MLGCFVSSQVGVELQNGRRSRDATVVSRDFPKLRLPVLTHN